VPVPKTDTERSQLHRARVIAAQSCATALALADEISDTVRADVAHLLIAEWSADVYAPAREVLRAVATGEAPPVEVGQGRIAVAVRLVRAVTEAGCRKTALAQLDRVIGGLRRAWLGRPADAPETELLRQAHRTVASRLQALDEVQSPQVQS